MNLKENIKYTVSSITLRKRKNLGFIKLNQHIAVKKKESRKKINKYSFLCLIIPLKFRLTVNLSKLEFGCNWGKLLPFDSFLIDR